MRQGLHDFLIAVHLQTHAYARQTTSQEYVIPLITELTGKNVFDPDCEDRYPKILGPVVSILPEMKSEPLKSHIVLIGAPFLDEI
uniref:Ryanodine receptor junctional solenoid domain-containing protein n=1 Tax=Panagrolaimus davidi TaxID=227884 RepID=A0A914PH55_9BILA